MYRTDTIHLHSVSSLTLSIVVPAWSCTDTTDTYRTQRLDAWPYMCAWSQVLYIVQEEAMPPTSTEAQVAQLHVVTIKATISPSLLANDPMTGKKKVLFQLGHGCSGNCYDTKLQSTLLLWTTSVILQLLYVQGGWC